MTYKVAVVEDDKLISALIQSNLRKKGYQALCFSDAESLIDRLEGESFDLIVLDIRLPGISGIEALEDLRKKQMDIPVLMLTVTSAVHNKILALNLGADDYLVKPFHMDELLARVKVLLHRSHGKRSLPASHILVINGYRINLENRICESRTGEVSLSQKEAALLAFFSQHPSETLSRTDILEEVWGMDVFPTPRTIDNFVHKFRRLFEKNPKKPKHFLTVRHQGYRFES